MNSPDKDQLIETLLQQRDELYQELSQYREKDNGALQRAQQKNARYEAEIKRKDEKIKKLTDQLAWLRRKFWKPNSEKLIPGDPRQRRIDFDGLDALPEEKAAIKAAEKEIIRYERKKPHTNKKQAVREPLPPDLRRERRIIMPEGIDDENWVQIGKKISERLQFKPGELYVEQLIFPVFALKKSIQEELDVTGDPAGNKPVRVASPPLVALPRSNAGSSLLAELHLNKYLHHIPFNRQLSMLGQLGYKIAGSTVNGWFMASGDLLRPLYCRLRELTLESDYIQVDESTVPVINNKKKRAVKAYLWVVRSVMDKLVFFHYDKGSRSRKVVIDLLHSYRGAVQTDGFQAYSIYEGKQGVLLLGCWAHSRRKFYEAIREDKAGAEYALAQIGKLYTVESMATDENMSYAERAALRERLSYPIIQAFEKWILDYHPKTIPGGLMSKALTYTYKQLHKLSRYHLDGRYQLDNNLVENSLRPLAIGRRNYMFCGNHEAAENAAIMYSLLGTCVAHDVNPREWLIDVFNRIPQYKVNSSLDLADLLPHNWKKQKESTENQKEVPEAEQS